MPSTRDEVPISDQWDTTSLYSSWAEWESDFGPTVQLCQTLDAFKGRLGEEAAVFQEGLSTYLAIRRRIDRLVTYAHLRQDENLADDRHKACYQRATALLHRFVEQAAWIQPELLALPQEMLGRYVSDRTLLPYRFYLERLIHERAHTLSTREEELLSMTTKAFSAPSSAFSMLESADFRFDKVRDAQGKEHELTLGNYQLHQRSADRSRRHESFNRLHGKFNEYGNTICELLNGEVQSHVFQARARHFHSCVEAALFPHHIDVEVYRNLIAAVREGIEALYRYVSLRRQILGVSTLHAYDLMAPLVPSADTVIPYDRAVAMVLESVSPLGENYQRALEEGLGRQRWVDRFENVGKRSGAYSGGCYDSCPYILLNYSGGMRDVLTLAHEAGHSMHSFLSNQTQPYQYASYPIFVAEVASTFNEELLFRRLLQEATSSAERSSLINQRIDDIRATLFRQTMFAEFELWLHEMAEKGEPLTPSVLKEKYRELNADYYGPDLTLDDLLSVEWARIPHFYYNFYVYQYATGISAALYLVDHVSRGGSEARDAYLQFLSSGYSGYPLDLLQKAGVDMRSSEPIRAAIHRFDELVTQLSSESRH